MNKKIISAVIFAGLFGLASFAFAAQCNNCPPGSVCIPNPLCGVDTFPKLLTNIAQAVAGLIAVFGILMIIFSGFLFMTAVGNPEKIKTAKNSPNLAFIRPPMNSFIVSSEARTLRYDLLTPPGPPGS